MQKVRITNNEIIIYEINPNRNGLRRIKKRILNKATNLTMYTESTSVSKYPECFRLKQYQAPSKIITKMSEVYNRKVYTVILYPELVKIIEEFRRNNFEHMTNLVNFINDYPQEVSEIIQNLNISEIYRDNYNDYFELVNKLKEHGNNCIKNVVDDINENFIPNEVSNLLKINKVLELKK